MGNSLSCCIPPGSSQTKQSKRTRTSQDEGKPQHQIRNERGGVVLRSDGHQNSRGGLVISELTNGSVMSYSGAKHSESSSNIQHISEREPEDGLNDPSINPTRGPLFMVRSKSELRESRERKRRSQYAADNQGTPSDVSGNGSGCLTRKFNSCSTIYVDDSTVSQPNLRNTIKCVSLAICYHIKNRENREIRTIDIFDERLHPLTRDELPADYDRVDPEHRHIYRFLRTLFNAAQLTAECAIVTLVYLERLLTYGEMDIGPANWKRMVLGSVLLASKVWDDQAVWNVDYCQIMRDIKVEDMNELERSCLELLQFNINVPASGWFDATLDELNQMLIIEFRNRIDPLLKRLCGRDIVFLPDSVYAKYYFDLRSLADANDINFPTEQLSVERAQKLEALSRLCAQKVCDGIIFPSGIKRSSSLDKMASTNRRSVAILS